MSFVVWPAADTGPPAIGRCDEAAFDDGVEGRSIGQSIEEASVKYVCLHPPYKYSVQTRSVRAGDFFTRRCF